MRRIIFYATAAGHCPVQEHLDGLPDKVVIKIAWVLRVVRDLERVPETYFKKLTATDSIWKSVSGSAAANLEFSVSLTARKLSC